MIESVLQQIGLTQNEIKVYTALLEIGESKTGEILDKANLNSGRIYEILNSLEKKGLVSCILKEGIKHFSPADPSRVIEFIEEKKQELNKQEQDFNNILPNLMKKINAVKGKTNIEIFTGYNGMRTAYAKELRYKKGSTIYVHGIASSSEYNVKVWNFFRKNHYLKRHQRGYHVKKIIDINAAQEPGDHDPGAEIRFLPNDTLVSVNVIEDLTIIGIFTKDPICITIEDKDVADNFIKNFNILWKIAKTSTPKK